MNKGLRKCCSTEVISPLRVTHIKWLVHIIWKGMLGIGLDPRFYITPPHGEQTTRIIAELHREGLFCNFSDCELEALRWMIYPFADGRPDWMQNSTWSKEDK